MEYYNENDIVSVHIEHRCENDWFNRVVKKKGLFRRTEKVYYTWIVSKYDTVDELKKAVYEDSNRYDLEVTDDGVVYHRPRIIIKFINGEEAVKYFDTDIEANYALKDITLKYPYLKTCDQILTINDQ